MRDDSIRFRHIASCAVLAACVVLAGGCSDDTPTQQGSGGSGNGGATASGGSVGSGGATGSGGAGSGGKGSGGATSAGGSSAATGGSGSGGSTAGSGGSTSGAGGGTAATGGASGGSTQTGVDGGTAGAGGIDAGAGGNRMGGTTGGGAGGTGTGGQTGGSTGTSGKSAGCGKTPTVTTANNGTPISISVGGKQRRYVLNVPKNYDNSKPYKLIVTIHQLDGNDKQMHNWQYYGLLPLSNDTAIFAAPNGQKNGSPCSGTGDGDSGCGWPNSNGDDMALMDAVVAQVEENYCIDTNRIFATGWSYGASMSYEVGCQRPLGGTGSATWGTRAIAIYSGRQMSGSCKPSTAVGFWGAHGTNDNVLGYDSGVTLAQNFAKANGCTWATPAKASGAHVCTQMKGCKDGYPTEFCSFVGGHTPFPDSGQAQGSWGPGEAWKFLSQF